MGTRFGWANGATAHDGRDLGRGPVRDAALGTPAGQPFTARSGAGDALRIPRVTGPWADRPKQARFVRLAGGGPAA